MGLKISMHGISETSGKERQEEQDPIHYFMTSWNAPILEILHTYWSSEIQLNIAWY